MTHSLDDVTSASLALGTDHCRSLPDTAEGLWERAASTHERNSEVVLVDVVCVIGEGEHLALIDVVDLHGL